MRLQHPGEVRVSQRVEGIALSMPWRAVEKMSRLGEMRDPRHGSDEAMEAPASMRNARADFVIRHSDYSDFVILPAQVFEHRSKKKTFSSSDWSLAWRCSEGVRSGSRTGPQSRPIIFIMALPAMTPP